ncbi:pyridoxamine 5'-phosphate oxidase family protein [Emcibacter sp. SYSU 3D8]|uniref:pyridoxamine 5'-phosphate oxidase family protein n=1 Tax=Emcibacter sp. SYSU 3D8 TaxID=3133969 RepID=UPI0031FEFB31
MNEKTTRPAWFARREISPFTLDDDAVKEVLGKATHAVVSWVTKDCKPVSAVVVYVLIDGVITITSTTNRAKYHAWRRNPAACFCIWDPDNIGRQVTLRGQVEIVQSADLLRRFTETFLTQRNDGKPPSPERLATEIGKFDAPDRHMMQLHVEKVLTHDLTALFKAERDGTDVWS